MSNSLVKDKKKLSPPKKLWKHLVSTFRSKLHHLRKPQFSFVSRSTCGVVTTTIATRQHHHHHHYQTITNHHHHYYYPQPSHDQKQVEADTSLVIDNKVYDKPSSEGGNSLGKKDIRTITSEIDLFDDYDDEDEGLENEMESSNCFTLSQLQLLGVDAKAEEFINRRKEIWRLEKQKSEEEYWEMLARSA